MPTYNRANLIKKSIESVLAQTFTNFEFFILDDGSTDNTKEIVFPYLSDKRIKYFSHENCGEAETVNKGWELANGEYFTQLNSDDTIVPHSFSVMVAELDKHKDKILAYPDFSIIDENDKVISVTRSPDWNFKEALCSFSCFAASAGTFIRKSAFRDWKVLKKNRFKFINDIEMYWDMALVGDFLHIPQVLASWRVHPGQISHNRYQSISEVEKWFEYYFHKDTLPPPIKALEKTTRNAIVNYFLRLIDESDLSKKEKKFLSKPYLQELKSPVYEFSCLQIGDRDLTGRSFNGHNLHLYLRERNIDARHICMEKTSNDDNTYVFPKTKNMAKTLSKTKLFSETDIIHFHLIHNTDFDIHYLPEICAIKPAVITLHDPFFLSGHCIYHFDCEKWKEQCYDCPALDIPLELKTDETAINFIVKKNAIQSSQISAIVASDYMYDMVSQSPIWKNKKIYKIPFGINQNVFCPIDKVLAKKKLNIDPASIVLMFRSTLNPYKNLNLIKEALRKLQTNKNVILITIQEKELLSEFENKFQIREYGWVENEDIMAQLYQATDIFLMPSKQEAFGLMAIEAMSCCVPVLSIKGTSLERVTNSPECGLSVDSSEFSEALQHLINNPYEIKERALKSLEYAKAHYNKDDYVKNMINLYREIMRNHVVTPEWKLVANQIEKYAKLELSTQSRNKSAIRKIFYRLIARPILKFTVGKEIVKSLYDPLYF